MKLPLLPLCGILFALPLVARAVQTTDTVTVKLGPVTAVPGAISTFPPPPVPPITVIRGAHLQLVIAQPAAGTAMVQWQKDGQVLAAAGTTLDIPAAMPADSGFYSVKMFDAAGTILGPYIESVSILVTTPGQRIENVSTRAQISPSQPFFLTGFVVQAGPGQTRVIVRAVGPTLSAFGVGAALAAPQLQLMDAAGRVITPVTPMLYPPPSPNTAELEAVAVGAFPLVAGGKDVAQEYWLPAGAYTAVLSSADGGSGTALLEMYQLAY